MEGPLVASAVCSVHGAELASFTRAFLQPPELALERRAQGEPVLARILRAVDACPKCRHRLGRAGPERIELSSIAGPELPDVAVRLVCTRAGNGPWRCAYHADVKRKILLLGDASVDKSAMIRPLVYDEIPDVYRDLLGAKVMTRHETVLAPGQGVDFHVVFSVWDIHGHRFYDKRRMREFFRGAKAVLAVCDLAVGRSVEELGYWLTVAERTLGKVSMVVAARERAAPDPLPISEARLREAIGVHRAALVTLPRKDTHNLEHVFHGLGEETVRDVFGTKWRLGSYA